MSFLTSRITALLALFAVTAIPTVEAKDGVYEFSAVIVSLPADPGFIGDWVVGTKTVHVSASTELDDSLGTPAAGSVVNVKGTLNPDVTVSATKIEAPEDSNGDGETETEFKGVVDSLPAGPSFVGDWVVNGAVVHVSQSTRLDVRTGQPQVGALVEVEGAAQVDNSINADKIQIKSGFRPKTKKGVRYRGIVQALPSDGLVGSWTVTAVQVDVTSATKIQQKKLPVVIGAYVDVRGTEVTSGVITAAKIRTEAF